MKNIYGKVNRSKTKEARYYLLALYKRRLLLLLKAGYSPFLDNTELYYQNHTHKHPQIKTGVVSQDTTETQQTQAFSGVDYQITLKTPPKKGVGVLQVTPENPQKETVITSPSEINTHKTPKDTPPNKWCAMGVKDALVYSLGLKANLVSNRTMVDYKSRCDIFYKWLEENSKEVNTIEELSKKHVSEFLNYIQLKTSARNRNNYRTCLSTIFQTLEDNEIIEKNFIKNISTLKTKPERNKSYTKLQEETIFSYLEEKDPNLLLFIKFISYNFLRPLEVCRLKVGDINFEEKILQIRVKNKPLKTKIIPEILLKELSSIRNLEADLLLFTPQTIGGVWEAELTNRRNYFSKRFRTIVKIPYNLDKNYGLHSFRHTFITKLYRALVKESTPFAAKSSLMQITGHTTMKALEMYLRDIDAELPNDYSELLK
jgi:integrase